MFLKVFGVCEKCLFFLKMDCEQETKNILPTQKVFCSFLPSFNIAILLLIGKKPYLWMSRDGCGSSYSYKMKCFEIP